MAKQHKSMRDPKSKAKGHVRFLPYEDLDDQSHREVCKFQVAPFGSILETCKHIPYNSGKKDFFEKTGRESFEGKRRKRKKNHIMTLGGEDETPRDMQLH